MRAGTISVAAIAALAKCALAQSSVSPTSEAIPAPTVFLGGFKSGPNQGEPAVWFEGNVNGGCNISSPVAITGTDDPCSTFGGTGSVSLGFGVVNITNCGNSNLNVQTRGFGQLNCMWAGSGDISPAGCPDLTYGWSCAATFPTGQA